MATFKPPVHDEFVINLDAGKCLGARLGMIVRTVGRRTAWTASSSRRRAKKLEMTCSRYEVTSRG